MRIIFFIALAFVLNGCMSTNPINTPIKASEQQFSLLLNEAEKTHKIPRTVDEK